MVKSSKISATQIKKHKGQTAISLDGKVIAFGKNAVDALKKAKHEIPDIKEKEFAISRIHHTYLAA